MKTSFAMTAAVAVLFVAADASAQTIRNYQKEAESAYGQPAATTQSGEPNYGYVPPGAPRPGGQPAPTGEQPKGEEGKEGDAPDMTNYEIKMSNGTAPTGRSTKLDLKPEEMYRGVIPGTRDQVTHLNKARQKGESSTNRVLWIGFQPREQSTRVFIQTAREASYEVSAIEGGVVLTLSDAKLSARNFSRFIDTSYFGRNVQRIETKKVGRSGVEVRIMLNKAERPQVNATQNYVYLEFSPDSTNPEATSTDEKSDSEAADSPRALDD